MTETITALSRPTYARPDLKPRLLHIGFGAFAKAHVAVFHDEMLRQSGSNWGVVVTRLHSGAEDLSDLDAADHLFTIGEMSDDDLKLRQIGAVIKTLHPKRDGITALVEQIADPDLSVITLTITEKGYCLSEGRLDLKHPGIIADLDTPQAPKTAIGVIVEGLRLRKAAGLDGLTVLSCDNLPTNGTLCRAAIMDFAAQQDAELSRWITQTCRFPCSMVDRITPAMTEASHQKLRAALGTPDPHGILCEPFRQWVIEDSFATDRPPWDLAEATFVDDVEPYEDMKLRMLNGSHSFLAYLGALSGKETIADCMADPVFKKAAHTLMMTEQAKTLEVPEGFDIAAYADDLIARFSNTALRHKTTQIASDGSQKLPQRLLNSVHEHLKAGRAWPLTALAIAGWMRYCRGQSEEGVSLPLNDPLAEQINALVSDADDDAYVVNMTALPGVFGSDLPADPGFVATVTEAYRVLTNEGCRAALAGQIEG